MPNAIASPRSAEMRRVARRFFAERTAGDTFRIWFNGLGGERECAS